jgi:hypothetical protein
VTPARHAAAFLFLIQTVRVLHQTCPGRGHLPSCKLPQKRQGTAEVKKLIRLETAKAYRLLELNFYIPIYSVSWVPLTPKRMYHQAAEAIGCLVKLSERDNAVSQIYAGQDCLAPFMDDFGIAATLDVEIEKLQAEIDRYNTDSVRADKFIELVKRHTEFNEFSASLLNEFVEKIIVPEATKVNGVREQEVEIYLNFIGKFDLTEQEEQPEETPVRKSRSDPHRAAMLKKERGGFSYSYPFQTEKKKGDFDKWQRPKLRKSQALRKKSSSLKTRKSGLSRSRKSRSARIGQTGFASAWDLSRDCCRTPSR